MKADEIRKWMGAVNPNIEPQTFQLMLLQEIAAQLAELNQNLRDIHPELNMPEECRQHTCDYYTHYLAYGEPEMGHEAFHSQVRQGTDHFKSCTYNGPNICRVCEGYEKRLRA